MLIKEERVFIFILRCRMKCLRMSNLFYFFVLFETGFWKAAILTTIPPTPHRDRVLLYSPGCP
jgi:hypothetical protein